MQNVRFAVAQQIWPILIFSIFRNCHYFIKDKAKPELKNDGQTLSNENEFLPSRS